MDAFRNELLARNIITKHNNEYLFIGDGSNIDIDAIEQRLANLSENVLEEIEKVYNPNIPCLHVIYGNEHWSYLSPNGISTQNNNYQNACCQHSWF